MIPVSREEKTQIDELIKALSDMSIYLERLEHGPARVVEPLYNNKAAAMESLLQIIEGLGYCSQLFQSATILLAIDISKEPFSLTTFNAELSSFLENLDQATINEDYSLLSDLIEYDLITVIHSAQELLKKLMQHCCEGKV